jgi:hypothetical protein
MALESASVTSPSWITGTWPKAFMARKAGVLWPLVARSISMRSKGRPSSERNSSTRCEWPETATRYRRMGWAGRALAAGVLMAGFRWVAG